MRQCEREWFEGQLQQQRQAADEALRQAREEAQRGLGQAMAAAAEERHEAERRAVNEVRRDMEEVSVRYGLGQAVVAVAAEERHEAERRAVREARRDMEEVRGDCAGAGSCIKPLQLCAAYFPCTKINPKVNLPPLPSSVDTEEV